MNACSSVGSVPQPHLRTAPNSWSSNFGVHGSLQLWHTACVTEVRNHTTSPAHFPALSLACARCAPPDVIRKLIEIRADVQSWEQLGPQLDSFDSQWSNTMRSLRWRKMCSVFLLHTWCGRYVSIWISISEVEESAARIRSPTWLCGLPWIRTVLRRGWDIRLKLNAPNLWCNVLGFQKLVSADSMQPELYNRSYVLRLLGTSFNWDRKGVPIQKCDTSWAPGNLGTL